MPAKEIQLLFLNSGFPLDQPENVVRYKDPLYLCKYKIVTERCLFLFKFIPWFSVIWLPKAIQDSNKKPLFSSGPLYP